MVRVVRLVEVIRVVEVVYRYEENLGVKGPNNKNKKDVGLPMTMPQAAGKNLHYGNLLNVMDYPCCFFCTLQHTMHMIHQQYQSQSTATSSCKNFPFH